MTTNGGTKETLDVIILYIAIIISHKERASIEVSVISIPLKNNI